MHIFLALLLTLMACSDGDLPPCPDADLRPKVVPLGTGGTIQSKDETRMTRHDYRAGRYDISELLDALPEVHTVAQVEARQLTKLGSPALTMENWIDLAREIDSLAAHDSDIAGFVVTHGTNTLEETAYFLHLTLQTDRPVVLVGPTGTVALSTENGERARLEAVGEVDEGRRAIPESDPESPHQFATLHPSSQRLKLVCLDIGVHLLDDAPEDSRSQTEGAVDMADSPAPD